MLIELLEKAQVLDLTHTLDSSTIYWPTDTKGFQLEELAKGPTPAGFYYSANSFCTAEHGGTHLDAPIHFAEGAESVERIPLDRLLGPAVVIDISAQAAADPDYRLTLADVLAWEKAHGRVPAGAIVVLATGWSKRWPDRKAYLGDDTPGDASNLHFPSYGREAAELLVNDRQVAVLGLDTPSIDHGPSRDFIVHQIAAKAGVAGLENLAGRNACRRPAPTSSLCRPRSAAARAGRCARSRSCPRLEPTISPKGPWEGQNCPTNVPQRPLPWIRKRVTVSPIQQLVLIARSGHA